MNQSLNAINSAPIYRRSTFRNEDVLIWEPASHVTSLRILMVMTCIIIGIATLAYLVISVIKYRLKFQDSILHRIVVPVLLMLNILFHVAHYSHNIYDPVAYYEPKKLYVERIITHMEPTFLFNIPLSIVFIIASRKLLLSCTIGHLQDRSMPIMVTIYSLMSIVSIGHFTYEPATNFSLMCKITIAGEPSLALLLLIVAWRIHSLNSEGPKMSLYSPIKTKANSNLKYKLSDNTSSEEDDSI